MKPYLALVFCKKDDLRSYGAEVVAAIRSVAGERMKYAEGTSHLVAIGFATDRPSADIQRAFKPLWRAEQRTWVLPIESPLMIDLAIMEWLRRQV
ncbi:MAG: hypothetical protein LT106_18745 [Burkholderiaceae bacterium]|nr:hypothetical protein [Burkholderiaceae bacterium]